MAGEIAYPGDVGLTYYAQVYRPTDNHVWNADVLAFQSVAYASWTMYDIPLTAGVDTPIYLADFPAGITTAGLYPVVVYEQLGAAPDANDPVVGTGEIDWGGDAVISLVEPYVTGSVSDATPAVGEFTAAAGLSATNDFYNEQWLAFTSGALQGIARKVSDYVGATRTFTFSGNAPTADDAPFPTAPANGDTFVIVGHG